jgi:hypothetical protein
MDSLTTHYLARELAARWSGRRVHSCVVDREGRTVTIAADGSRPVCFNLAAPEIRVTECAEPQTEGVLSGGWVIADVSAPIDDRRLELHVERSGKFRGSRVRRAVLAMSFIPAARGAALADGGHRIATIGTMPVHTSEPRRLLTQEEVRHAVSGTDTAALLRGRWMSPALARWLVHVGPARAAELYEALTRLPEAQPSQCGAVLLPFPWCEDAQPVASLIEGAPAGAGEPERQHPAAGDRRLARMREELARAGAAPDLRRVADALMAMGDVPAPADVQLADGALHAVDARPGETAVAAAERLYREVRSMERALQSLPTRIAALERDAPPAGPARRDAGSPARSKAARGRLEPRAAVPYRRYRSSGGLEIWVGRGAASNDALTFRHAAPHDVWLHARDAAGAHVVLRWPHDESPPARDLEEAAVLAAWHSKMRSSALVPVDWTRRKYVRKVRKGAPGLVTVQRAQTIFARPQADVERALRVW